MAFKCINCGSNVKFNISAHKLECESCGSMFEVKTYKSNSSGNISYDVYRCKSCGAELLGLDEEQTVYCSYCGTEAYLSEKTGQMDSPKKIIPFMISKEKVKEIYQKKIENEWFLPREFKDASFIDEFRGIYIPYWQTSVDIEEGDYNLTGVKTYTLGGYDYVEKYDIGVRLSGNFVTGQYDASRAFDDTIADSIAPFHKRDAENFQEGYLAGFYSDRANVSEEVYSSMSEQITMDGISKYLDQVAGMRIVNEDWKKNIKLEKKSDGISLLPVWFLTWRRNNRVAYSVVNGQTGKITTDLPVDYAQFFKYVLMGTAALFLILSIFPIFVLPLRLAGVSTMLMWISTYILSCEIKKIRQIEKHEMDFGFTGKLKKKGSPKFKKVINIILKILMWFVIFVAGSIAISIEVPSDLVDVTNIIFYMQFIIVVIMIINSLRIQNKLAIVPAIISLIASGEANSLAARLDPHDYINYIISFICLVVLVINALTSMFYINDLTTRPVPNFFNREGANNKYEAD